MTSLNLASNHLCGLDKYGHGTYDASGNSLSLDTFLAATLTCFIPNLGIIALANVIPDMRAILSVNLLKNNIGVEQARVLVIILKEHSTLKSLCGNKGNETELDMSGKRWGAEDAIMLAAEIIDNGAISKFTFSGDSSSGRLVGHSSARQRRWMPRGRCGFESDGLGRGR